MGHHCCKPYICLQCLDKTSERALAKEKELSIELANIRDEVAFNTAKCEKLQKEKETLERRFEEELRRLGWQQQAEVQELQERLQQQFQAESARLQAEHQDQLLRMRCQHQEQVEDITASHEAALLEMENNHTVAITILQDDHDHKVQELMSTHEFEKKELEENFEKLRLTLQIALAPYQHLEEDMQSLKQVLEMKNQQIHLQEKKIIELEKLVEKNIILEERIQVLQQQNEDLKARIDQNTVVTRQLSEENANLQEYVEKETQEKKRLSRTNEELLWKLQTGDPTSPIKLSPTSPVYRGSSSGPSSPARVSTTPR
uniref:Microtubule associated tumor suppressor candidate 2 n=2 Tax=Mus TaxID=862507 RepID=D3YZ69_MOUSE